MHIERPIGLLRDRGLLGHGLLLPSIQALEVQGPGGTTHHGGCNLVRGGRIHVHPGPLLRLEDVGQAAKAVTSMDAELGFPQDGNPIVVVDALDTRSLAFLLDIVCRDEFGDVPLSSAYYSMVFSDW
jgi:hypothetical protein